MDDQPHRRRRVRAGQTFSNPLPQDHPFSAEVIPPQNDTLQSDAENIEVRASSSPPRRRRKQAEDSLAIHDDTLHQAQAAPDTQHAVNKKKKAKRIPGLFQSIDAVVCRIGDCLLFSFKWIAVGLMFLLSFAAKGFKKAASHAVSTKRAVYTQKQSRTKTDAQEQSLTLEPTRPQDYRGQSEKRAAGIKKRTVRAPRSRSAVGYYAAMSALLCVAVVSLFMIGSILLRTVRTKTLSSSLSERYSQLSLNAQSETDEQLAAILPLETPTAAPASSPDQTAQPAVTPTPKPMDVVKTTKFHQVGGDALPEMEALYQENRDLVGWLRMEGILDLPVVYKDNAYYLKRDFYKNKSAAGTLFLDENHPFRENAQNLLLHGHNMKDGTMFGRLVQYETNLSFLKNNPFIQYSTLWNKEQYVIFAVLHVSLDVHSEQFFNYFTHHTFSSDAQFETYVRSLQNRSVFSIPVDVNPGDALLTLSTCLDNDRLVIVARRLRAGESKSELRQLVQLAAKQ